MSKKVLKSSLAMIMASLVIASGATVLTTGVAEAGNISVSAATVNEALTISNFSVSDGKGSDIFRVNDTLKFSATVTGGQRYKDGYRTTEVYIKDLNDYNASPIAIGYANNPSYVRNTWKPTKAGSYSATFKVVDYNGAVAESTINFTVVSGNVNISDFCAVSDSVLLRKGSRLTFKANITGATLYRGSYRIAYVRVMKEDGTQVLKRNWDNPSTGVPTWVPQEAGKYQAKLVYVDEDYKGSEAYFDFEVIESKVTSLQLSTATPVVNKEVTFSSTQQNVVWRYGKLNKYEIEIKRDGVKVKTLSDEYARAENLKWIPSRAGNYTATLRIVDFYGFEVPEKTISFKVADTLKVSNITSSRNSSITAGQSTVVSLKASDGAGSYKYACYYKRTADENNNSVSEGWKTLAGYVSNNGSFTFKTSIAGTYVVRIYAKDANGTSKFKNITITVAPALRNTTTISTSSARVNKDTVALACAAAGGKQAYKYSAFYRLSTDSKWTTLQNYSTNSIITTKFSKAGTYIVRAYVQDANGYSVYKEFSVVVK